MVLSKKAIEKIKNIIKQRHNLLLIATLGSKNVPKAIIQNLKDSGIDVSKYDPKGSFLDLAYHHNLLFEDGDIEAPKTAEESAQKQFGKKPKEEEHGAAIEHLNSNMEQLIDKQAFDVLTRIEGLIRDNNNNFRLDVLSNPNKAEALQEMTKKNTVAQLKQKLRDTSKDADRNWSRVAATEISNAVGLGSVDRIVTDNKGENLGTVYAYRVNPNDAATCKYCRKFYIDSDGSPKLYRLSTLIGNGSNYGKKAAEWKPIVLATHPNCRDSQVLELKPGWALKPGGTVEYVGVDSWQEYINKKLK
jgi:hypothetical protein